MIDYVVVSTSNIDYQAWQVKLLIHTFEKVGQEGRLIILDSEDVENRPFENYENLSNKVIHLKHLPNWAKQWEHNEKDWWGGIPNKYESYKWLLDNFLLKEDDTLLFLDPDMIFIRNISANIDHGEVIAQKWLCDYDVHYCEYIFSELIQKSKTYRQEKSCTIPFIITVKTLRKVIPLYCVFSKAYRKITGDWISEMYGLTDAFIANNIQIKGESRLGLFTKWYRDSDEFKEQLPHLIHYPNEILDKEGNRIWFKQDFTRGLEIAKEQVAQTVNLIDRKLLEEVYSYFGNETEEQEPMSEYHRNFPLDLHIGDIRKLRDDFKSKYYNGSAGFVQVIPWKGGFNNVRMSLEIAICIAYLSNRTLILDDSMSQIYLMHSPSKLSDYFDLKILEKVVNIEYSKEVDNNLGVYSFNKTSCENVVLNFEKILPPRSFTKSRRVLNLTDSVFSNKKLWIFDDCLLGDFKQVIFSRKEDHLTELIQYFFSYKEIVYGIASSFIKLLPYKYNSIHIRRNDLQYKEVFTNPSEVYSIYSKKIKEKTLPCYISTDCNHEDYQDYFRRQNVEVYDWKHLEELMKVKGFTCDPNLIPLIEQIICAYSAGFIGTAFSTFSNYVYRLRHQLQFITPTGYCTDYLVTTHHADDYTNRVSSLYKESSFIAPWYREYPPPLSEEMVSKKTIFVSIASYCDSDLINTINSLFEKADYRNRITAGVYLQDTLENYQKLKENIKDSYNVKIEFLEKEKSEGVVKARNFIKENLYGGEDFFLQIDSHSRFKQDWDSILINQYLSIEDDRVVISTYPNEFLISEKSEEYFRNPNNTALEIDKFLNLESDSDFRLKAKNTPPLRDFEIKQTRWIAAGFIFTKKQWLEEIHIPDTIRYGGEEDYQTHLSFLKGWNLYITSEATVWHNYDYRNDTTKKPYREHNPNLHIGCRGSMEVKKLITSEGLERSVEDLENYLNIQFKKYSGEKRTIFIALTSFIDADLRNTILSCVQMAKHPENLSFGLILQYNNHRGSDERCVDDLIEQYNIRVEKYYYQESQGGCWARSRVSKLYKDEDFVLQIDCHVRMIKDWDEILIKEYDKLPGNPIITYLSPPFKKDENTGQDHSFERLDNLQKLNFPIISEITEDYWPKFQGYSGEYITDGINKQTPLLYAGFVFTKGSWIVEVENDPEHYYTGEEFALSIRSFTHGYDLYQPTQVVSWHRSYGNHIHHFTVFGDHEKRHTHAMKRLKLLVDGGDLGKYGLGSSRTLEQYESYAKLNIKKRNVYT